MHRLHKISKASATAVAVRNIPWFILNTLVFTALSLWIAFRRTSNAISNHIRRK